MTRGEGANNGQPREEGDPDNNNTDASNHRVAPGRGGWQKLKTTMVTVARRNNSQRCVRSLASHATMARLPGDVRDPSVALLPTTGPRPTQNSEFTQPSTAAMWAAAQVSVGGGAVGRKKSQPGHCRFRSKYNSTALDFCKRCQGR